MVEVIDLGGIGGLGVGLPLREQLHHGINDSDAARVIHELVDDNVELVMPR